MLKSPLASNPFALMMNPDAVVQAMETSDRLRRLQRRICKPLDKPLDKPPASRPASDAAAFDREVDALDDLTD